MMLFRLPELIAIPHLGDGETDGHGCERRREIQII